MNTDANPKLDTGECDEGTDRLNEASLTWHFPGGKVQAIATLHCAIRDGFNCSDELAMKLAPWLFDEISKRRDGEPECQG